MYYSSLVDAPLFPESSLLSSIPQPLLLSFKKAPTNLSSSHWPIVNSDFTKKDSNVKSREIIYKYEKAYSKSVKSAWKKHYSKSAYKCFSKCWNRWSLGAGRSFNPSHFQCSHESTRSMIIAWIIRFAEERAWTAGNHATATPFSFSKA